MRDDTISRQAAIKALSRGEGCGNICRRALERLPAVDAVPVVRWIPCRERLPKYGKTVLITNDKGNVGYGRFRGVEFWKEDGDNFWQWKKNTIEHVVAWMPLPDPYKEE